MSFIIDGPTDTDAIATDERPGTTPASGLPQDTGDTLRKANIAAGIFHLASSVVFLIIMTDFSLPITGSFATQDPALLEGAPPAEILATPRLGWGIAGFSLLSAFFRFLVAFPANQAYNRAIARSQNPFRWIEYAFSSTLMILLISMLLGIYDVAALIGIGGANVAMILFGWQMERSNTPGRNVDWFPFLFGCVAGLVPWAAIAVYLNGAIGNSEEAVPVWVWVILFSIFALFNCFAINQFLQYKQIGKWSNYVFGEKTFIALSFIAKTALLWQIHFGTVR